MHKYADKIKNLILMDDKSMSLVFDGNTELTGLLIRIILERNDITVTQVVTQKEYKSPAADGNKVGKAIRLDIAAIDSDGKWHDIEVQRRDKEAFPKRARYYSSMMDVRMLRSGEDYERLADSYVIFITENDVLGKGKPIYHIYRTVYESDFESFGDGSHIIYVNGKYQDESSALGKLMHDFQTADPDNMYYREIAERVRAYKEDNGGGNMISVFDEIEMEAKEAGWAAGIAEGRAKGIAEGRAEGREIGIYGTVDAYREFNVPDEEIVKKIMQKYDLTPSEAEKFVSNKVTA